MTNINKKRVCFIAQANGWGGAEAHTVEFIKYLISNDFYVEYVSCQGNVGYFIDKDFISIDKERLKIVRTDLSIFMQHGKDLRLWIKFLKQINSKTLVFQHLCIQHGSLQFFQTCRKAFDNVFLIEHTFPEPDKEVPHSFQWFIKRKLNQKQEGKKVSKCADKIIAVSNDVRTKLINHLAYPVKNTHTVSNGINWREFQAPNTAKSLLKKKYNIPESAKVFGVLARLSYEKGVDMGIEAFNLFVLENPNTNAYLIIAGKGSEKINLEELMRKYKLDEKIIFTGFLKKANELLPLFDFILVPSRREGLPFALLEGMSAGCIPIVFEVGGMPELINNSDLGWVIEPNNITKFSFAMAQVTNLSEEKTIYHKTKILNHIKDNFDSLSSFQKIIDTCQLGE